MVANPRLGQATRPAGWPRGLRTAVLMALVTAVALGGVLLLPAPGTYASHPDPVPGGRVQVAAYQVTLSVGTGAQYDVLQGARLDLPVVVSVIGGMKLASATVLVQYNPLEFRPAACVRQDGAPGGYCNIGWDTAKGLVRLNILSGEGVLGENVGLFILTFEPAPTATLRRVTSITPLLESIADVQGNYMTSWMQGSTARVMPSSAVGTAVYVGGPGSPNPLAITRGLTTPVPVVVTGVAGLGSATFSLSFDPSVVRPLECRPVQQASASGTCAMHSDHVSANLMSNAGLSGTITAFEVVFTTGPTAISGAESPLNLTLGAFADTAYQPITVRLFNNSIKVSKTAGAVVPVLRMTPADQYLPDDQRVNVQVILDNGTELAAGSWGIRYDSTIVQAENCQLYANGVCNATGEAGLVRMSVLSTASGGPPSNIGTLTFRRHPQAKSQQKTSLALEVTNFANVTGEQLGYQTQSANITIADTLGSGPAVAMSLVGVPPYQLPPGASLDFPINFQIDSARPIVNLSGSIHYNPLMLRPTRCMRYDQGSGPAGYCNAEYDRQNGIIRYNLLADSEAGISGAFTPFVFTMEAASTAKSGDNSPLNFTVEAISGPNGVPRTWSAVDESVSVKVPIPAPRVLVGPPDVQATSFYTVYLGFTQTVPVWVEAVPDLGAGTVEVRYGATVARATRCTLRPDLTPALNGGFCSLLPGVVRAAFVSPEGITGNAHVFDIEFAQAPTVIGGETTPLNVVVNNFVNTHEVPIPTSIRSGRLDIACLALPVADLSIARSGDNLQLTWSHVGDTALQYQVWRADAVAYFALANAVSTMIATVAAPTTVGATVGYLDVDGVLDPAITIGPWADGLNHFYTVRSMCSTNQGSSPSNRVGKFTFALASGSGQ